MPLKNMLDLRILQMGDWQTNGRMGIMEDDIETLDDDTAIRGSFTLRNFGRAHNTCEGHVHYLDRVESEYAAKNPINRFFNFINRHNPWRR